MSSKLRLSGKGTRGTAALSEKEQIDLAIALSLQQQGKETQPAAEPQLAPDGPSGSDHAIEEPGVAPTASNALDEQLGDEPRKRRAAALRRTYAVEESDSEGSPASSAGRQGADDYMPESSGSESDADDDSDFAGDDDSEDEGPRKKRKAEGKGKKLPAKAPGGNKKSAAAGKATCAAAVARGAKPAVATRAPAAAGARGRKGDAAVAPAPAPAVPVPRPPVSKPTATTRPALGAPVLSAAAGQAQQEDAGRSREVADTAVDTEAGPQDPNRGGHGCERPDGACARGLPPQPGHDVDVVETAARAQGVAGKALQPTTAVPKVTEPKAKAAAAPKQAATKPPPVAKLVATKDPAQVAPIVPKLPSKPLTLTNRATLGAAPTSAPFKPPIGPAGGGASVVKASTPLLSGAMPYRVPGLRRPGGSSVTKKSS